MGYCPESRKRGGLEREERSSSNGLETFPRSRVKKRVDMISNRFLSPRSKLHSLEARTGGARCHEVLHTKVQGARAEPGVEQT